MRHPQSENQSPGNVPSAVTSAKRFDSREVPRSQINPAAYNPRSLSEYARKQLKKSIERYGLVEPLVWNARTGILVSGHQRLSILDEKEGYPKTDYLVPVAVVDLDDKKERELNVWLNQRSAQGQFDKDRFTEFLGSMPEINLDDLGFTPVDIELEFGSLDGFDSFFDREDKAAQSAKDEIQAIKDRKKKVREDNHDAANASEDADYYLMVVFNSSAVKEQWLSDNHFPAKARFISQSEYDAALGGDARSDARAVVDAAVERIRKSEDDESIPYWRACELMAADWLAGLPDNEVAA